MSKLLFHKAKRLILQIKLVLQQIHYAGF